MAINIDVINDSGEATLWKIEGPGTTILAGRGFNKQMLSNAADNGENITVVLHPLKTGKPGGLLQAITMADGSSYRLGEEYQSTPAGVRRRTIPSLVEWVPPPEGETWQEREKKTRPAQLPLIGNSPRQTGAGALDPENLGKIRPSTPFDLTGTWTFRGEDRGDTDSVSYTHLRAHET